MVNIWAIAGMRNVVFLQSKMHPQSAASKLGERMGCGCPFHSRITLGTLSEQLSIGRNDSRISGFMLEVNISWRAQLFGGVEGWQLLLRIVLDVSCVRTMRECSCVVAGAIW